MVLSPHVRKGKVSTALGDFGAVTTVGNATVGGNVVRTAASAITAFAGGGKASATPLTAVVNHVTTVATAADSVLLPAAVVGAEIVVINGAASNSMQVFGAGTDTINDVATGTGVAHAAGKTATYYCPVAGKWYRNLSA